MASHYIRNVFLNVPYDKEYERLFIALLASLISIGRIPRVVLDVPSKKRRLDLIHDVMDECRMSIHDLSRVGTPVRFNMPFELGLACNLKRLGSPHDFFIMERVPHRGDRTLSDIKGHDPLIHHGTIRGIIWCVFDVLVTRRNEQPEPKKVLGLYRTLRKNAVELKREARRSTIFHTSLFNQLVSNAADRAQEAGFIE